MPSKCCTEYVSKSGRPSSGHRTEKGQSSPQFPRRDGTKACLVLNIFSTKVLKNILTIQHFHSSPILVRSCLKSCLLGFSIMRTKNFQMLKLDLEKPEEPEIKWPTSVGSSRKQEFQKNIYFCFIDCMGHHKL